MSTEVTSIKKQGRGQMSESFLLGSLLAVTGGFLDAYTYLARGKVFANAQTGNIVLLGLNIAEGNLKTAVRYLIPILAFVLGIILAEIIRDRYQHHKRKRLHWRQIVILIETLVIFFVCLMPEGRYDNLANTAVSFVCSMQVESFRKVRGNAFATTMCTGNLRSATEHLFHYRKSGDRETAIKSLQYYGIILFFLAGSVAGVLFTNLLSQNAALICCLLLMIVFAIMFIEKEMPIIGKNI